MKKRKRLIKKVKMNFTSALSTGMYDEDINEIYLGDQVEFCGMKGVICFECGAFGIGIKDGISYVKIQELMNSINHCCGNTYHGCFNDHFISLYEIYNAFNCEEDCLYIVNII